MNGGAMKIKKALQENRDGNDAAGEDRPHEQPTLLDVINHGGYSLSAFLRPEQAGVNGGSDAPGAMLNYAASSPLINIEQGTARSTFNARAHCEIWRGRGRRWRSSSRN